ncbi:iron complex outermembrane receptor protein [Stakelama pacifica]|uniref:Iron complex outermembrane receptor protein n=2 Tax=Stakelama pacifica TaxID=517720 RepID=A0A4R6G0N8_9SPHN|nr:iron complex outermembrane receptor protein [Stakelama pacifica]GGO91382.1 TonB-dependent receptor [Stakelama pacifica]
MKRAAASNIRAKQLFSLGVSAIALMIAPTVRAQSASSDGGQGQQTDTSNQDGATAPGAVEDIIVTGFRQSLENAVAEKRLSNQVVESVSAEDIGKLPDASIAESIARLPGLTSQRVSGRSNQISIRGFAPDFSTTLLNGREQTSTGDNRAVEYDQYPSEVINQVLVYKTADASLIGQGLSGTVDLRTIRPLEYGKRVLSIGGRGTYADLGKLNAGSDDKGYRVNATYVDQFFNDTLGVSLAASYLHEPYQIQEFNSWGYAQTADDNDVIGGSKSYVTSTVLKRMGLQGTVEWQPTPQLKMTLDGFYSDFNDDQVKRGIELPLGYGANGTSLLTGATVEDGLVTSGTFNDVEGVVRNDSFQRKAKLYSFGYNTTWHDDNGWTAQLDLSYSRTDRQEIVLESYSGTGYGAGNGATDDIGFTTSQTGTVFTHTLDYSDPSLILLTDSLGWGGDTKQAGYYNDRDIKDEINQYRLEVEKETFGSPISKVRFGMNYTKRTKRLTPTQYFLTLADGSSEAVLPDQYRLDPTSITYLGLGPILSYDPRDLLYGGIYSRVVNNSNDVVSTAFRVQEDVMTTYLQGNIDQPIGASTLTGNIGVQAVFTEQKSSGLVYNGTTFGEVMRGDNYVDVLPSLNLSLRLPTQWVFRVAVARQMQRPRMDDMRAANKYSYNAAEGILTGEGGNPYLRPIRSNSADFTVEKYFGNTGYLAIQTFYKDLKSFVYTQEAPFDFSGYQLPTGITEDDLVSRIGRNSVPVNGDGGSIYGAELAGTLQFGELFGELDGFGATGGLSYTKTKIRPSPGTPAEDIPGYSKWVANGTVFFEKWGLNVRGSVRYRSSFVGELSGFGAQRVRRRARDETIVDAQIGYDFKAGPFENVSVFLQGQNLTDEPFVTINGDNQREVIDYQTYGRRFLAGASLRF